MKIFILAGEKSGDNYGALLCKNLKKLKRDIIILGTGGKEMEKEGVEIIKSNLFGIMGFSGVIKRIVPYYIFLKKVLKKIKEENPDLIIFIDNPAFNLRIAERLRKRYRTCYYIPPKIWAYHKYNIKILRKYIDFVIPIFPFEKDIYEKENIPNFYFGHPFIDLIKNESEILSEKEQDEYLIGILPGSRKEEVKYNLPVMMKVAEILNKEKKTRILISASESKIEKIIKNITKNFKLEYSIIDDLYKIIKSSDVVLAVSGTVNLEVAYFEKPMIVFYKTSILNYLLAKWKVKLKMISPVNIVVGRKIVPEYVQNFKIVEVVESLKELLNKGLLYIKEINGFKKLKETFKEKNVSEKIAKFIIEGILKC